MDLAIPAAVAGPRGPRATYAAGEAWVLAASAAVDLAVAVADGAAADFEVAVEVGVSAPRKYHMFWRIGYVPPGSESQS